MTTSPIPEKAQPVSSHDGESTSIPSSTASPNLKRRPGAPYVEVQVLTPSEIESMRREFKASMAWMDEMIRSGRINDL